nr:unnamed protein product [Spirometra erinaceieuropaei]
MSRNLRASVISPHRCSVFGYCLSEMPSEVMALARFYDLPKVHKVGAPFRPIVSLKGTPTYEVGPTENCPVVEDIETTGTHDGSVGREVKISRDTEREVEFGSHGQIDALQSKRRHNVKQTRKYTPTLYTIEEVSKEQEEKDEEEYFANKDVEDEEYVENEGEIEKMSNDGLSRETKEEQRKAEEVAKEDENEKRQREVAESKQQVEVGRVVVEEEEGVVGETVEDTRQNVDEKVKKDEEANEMTESKQDAMLYCQLFSDVLDSSERKMKTEGTLLKTAAKYEAYGATSTSGDVLQQLTRAENWAMKRHVGQWKNACASAESNNLLDHRRRRSTLQRLRHVWRRYEVGPTEICPVVQDIETTSRHDGSAGCEVEMSRDTGRTVDSGSPGQMDAQQSKRKHTVKQTRKYTPKLYTIEEVSKEQEEEEEEEYFENEDVEEGEYEEDEDEIETMRNDGLSEESKEEQLKAEKVEEEEEKKRECEVAESEEQVEAGRVLVEEDGGVVGETVEDTR